VRWARSSDLGLLRFDGQEIGKSCKMKSIKDNPVKIRRKFDQNFKREALQNWFNSGKSAEVIAGELGLNSNLLYAWKKRFAPDGTGQRAPAAAKPGSVADLQAQLDAAHRENRHLREQRDILKKTLGILSEPPASVMNGSTR
jgi:transposase-like protein